VLWRPLSDKKKGPPKQIVDFLRLGQTMGCWMALDLCYLDAVLEYPNTATGVEPPST
jgi:hypothetical protein